MNQKDIDDLFKEVEEEYGLNPYKNNSKNNNKKKETIEDRIIKRCERIQQVCSMVLDQHPEFGIAKGIYECIKGKDFITEEKLTPGERALCGFGALTGLGRKFTNTKTMGGIFLKEINKVTNLITTGKDLLELGMDIGMDIALDKKREMEQKRLNNKGNNKNRKKINQNKKNK